MHWDTNLLALSPGQALDSKEHAPNSSQFILAPNSSSTNPFPHHLQPPHIRGHVNHVNASRVSLFSSYVPSRNISDILARKSDNVDRRAMIAEGFTYDSYGFGKALLVQDGPASPGLIFS